MRSGMQVDRERERRRWSEREDGTNIRYNSSVIGDDDGDDEQKDNNNDNNFGYDDSENTVTANVNTTVITTTIKNNYKTNGNDKIRHPNLKFPNE